MNEQHTKYECTTDSESREPLTLNDLASMQIPDDNFDRQKTDGVKFDKYTNQGYVKYKFYKHHRQTIKEDNAKENSTKECCLCM